MLTSCNIAVHRGALGNLEQFGLASGEPPNTIGIGMNSPVLRSTALDIAAAADDAAFVDVWLNTKVSGHTRRAYRTEAARFSAAAGKPLARVTLQDLQAYAERLGQGGLRPASQ